MSLRDLFEDDMSWYSSSDDVNGGRLKTDEVKEARKIELDWLHHHGVHVRRQFSECLQRTGAKPTPLLWIDTNKNEDVKENYRSRLVVREMRYKGEDGPALPPTFLFSAMSPL